MSYITITLHDPKTGRSESMPVPSTLTIQEVLDLGKALLDLEGTIVVTKYGSILSPPSKTLAQAGVANGDLLAFLKSQPRTAAPAPAASTTQSSGGLDFSSLLGSATSAAASAPASGGLYFSSLLAAPTNSPKTVYYPGMSFEEAYESNPHPKAI